MKTQNFPRTSARRFHSPASFNLVELSLAVAVVAVGVVSVFGILPHILKNSRQAVENSAITLLIQNEMDEVGTRGRISNLANTVYFPTTNQTMQVTDGGFIANQTIYTMLATNADSTFGGSPQVYQTSSGKQLLRTCYFTYTWGNTNSANATVFTFITECALTEGF